jgi:hypothetical protein
LKHLANACSSGFIGCQECLSIQEVMQDILRLCYEKASDPDDDYPAHFLAFDILEMVGLADYPYLGGHGEVS